MNPSSIIVTIYDIALILSGLLAFGAIVFGAITYTVAAGNPSKQHEGRAYITQALLGVLLLFAAYLILHTINPGLVENLDLPTLEKIDIVSEPGTNIKPKPQCTLVCCSTCNPPEYCKIIGNGQACVHDGQTDVRMCGAVVNGTEVPGICPQGLYCAVNPGPPPHYFCETIPPPGPPVGQ